MRVIVPLTLATVLVVAFQNCGGSVPSGGTLALSSSNVLSLITVSDVIGAGQSTVLTTIGGHPPYSYSIISGSGSLVPVADTTSVTFTAQAGTPPQPVTQVRVTDSTGATAERSISTTTGLTVTYTPAAPSKYDSVVFTGINGTAPYTLRRLSGQGSLSGMTFSPSSTGGTTNFEITDATGTKTAFSITVTSPQLVTLYRYYDDATGEYFVSDFQNGAEHGIFATLVGSFPLFKTQLAGTQPIYKCQASVSPATSTTNNVVFSYTACAAGTALGANQTTPSPGTGIFGYYSTATRPNTKVIYYPYGNNQYLAGNSFPMSVTVEPSDIQYRGTTAVLLGYSPK